MRNIKNHQEPERKKDLVERVVYGIGNGLHDIVSIAADCVSVPKFLFCTIPGAIKGGMDAYGIPNNALGYGLVYVPLTVSAGIGLVGGGLMEMFGERNATIKYTVANTAASGAHMAVGYGIGYLIGQAMK
jgi:hypothetical protein